MAAEQQAGGLQNKPHRVGGGRAQVKVQDELLGLLPLRAKFRGTGSRQGGSITCCFPTLILSGGGGAHVGELPQILRHAEVSRRPRAAASESRSKLSDTLGIPAATRKVLVVEHHSRREHREEEIPVHYNQDAGQPRKLLKGRYRNCKVHRKRDEDNHRTHRNGDPSLSIHPRQALPQGEQVGMPMARNHGAVTERRKEHVHRVQVQRQDDVVRQHQQGADGDLLGELVEQHQAAEVAQPQQAHHHECQKGGVRVVRRADEQHDDTHGQPPDVPPEGCLELAVQHEIPAPGHINGRELETTQLHGQPVDVVFNHLLRLHDFGRRQLRIVGTR
eukprot:RCo022867